MRWQFVAWVFVLAAKLCRFVSPRTVNTTQEMSPPNNKPKPRNRPLKLAHLALLSVILVKLVATDVARPDADGFGCGGSILGTAFAVGETGAGVLHCWEGRRGVGWWGCIRAVEKKEERPKRWLTF